MHQARRSGNAAYWKSSNSRYRKEKSLDVLSYTSVARIIREWGVRGEMKALPLTDVVRSLVPETAVYLNSGNQTRRCTIKSFRTMNRHFVLSCYEIPDRNSASLFRGATVLIPADSLPKVEGAYFRDEIVGLAVVATDGDELGSVVDIMETPAHDVYVVAHGTKEFLVPAVREFIVEISLDRKRIIIKKMHGMFD